MPFDEWEAKRTTFGGDDGVEFIALAEIERMTAAPPRPGQKPVALAITITPQQFIVEIQWR